MRLLTRFIRFLRTPSRKRTRFLFFGTLFVVYGVPSLFCLFLWRTSWSSDWIREDVREEFGVAIPDDAVDVAFDGCRQGGNYGCLWLDLSFKSSPQSALNFASQLCEGGVYPHFNPFNAIVSGPVDYQYAVTISREHYPNNFSYYDLYSPASPVSDLGNRCFFWGPMLLNIYVDGSNPEQYAVRLDYYQTSIYTDHQMIDDFPLRVRGMSRFKEEKEARLSRICMEIDPIAYLENDMWSHLIGAEVKIYLEGELDHIAYISDQGMLTPRLDAAGNPFQPDGRYFNDCISGDWDRGNYTVTLEITPISGEIRSYSWQFHG